jgi:hypothetical protein
MYGTPLSLLCFICFHNNTSLSDKMNDISIYEIHSLASLYRKVAKLETLDDENADLLEKIIYISQSSLHLSDLIDKIDLELDSAAVVDPDVTGEAVNLCGSATELTKSGSG